MAKSYRLFTLHAQIRDIDPPIWRRVQVDGGESLRKHHHILQAAFGWHDAHLHEFDIDGYAYAGVAAFRSVRLQVDAITVKTHRPMIQRLDRFLIANTMGSSFICPRKATIQMRLIQYKSRQKRTHSL